MGHDVIEPWGGHSTRHSDRNQYVTALSQQPYVLSWQNEKLLNHYNIDQDVMHFRKDLNLDIVLDRENERRDKFSGNNFK